MHTRRQRQLLLGIVALGVAVGGRAETLNELLEQAQQAQEQGQYTEAIQKFGDARRGVDATHPNFKQVQVILLLAEAKVWRAAKKPLEALKLMELARFYAERADPKIDELEKELQIEAGDMIVSADSITRALGVARGFVTVEDRTPSVDVSVRFQYDSAELTERGERQAEEMLKSMQGPEHARHRFRLVGHTDTRGSSAYNLELSQRRARRLREWFLARSALDPGRIETRGEGENDPLLSGDSEAEHARNRRVELQLLP